MCPSAAQSCELIVNKYIFILMKLYELMFFSCIFGNSKVISGSCHLCFHLGVQPVDIPGQATGDLSNSAPAVKDVPPSTAPLPPSPPRVIF